MTPYEPIDCGFHDRLLHLATLRQPGEVEYRDERGAPRVVRDVITDVYSRGGAEFLRLGGGEVIRLDRLLRVDGHRRPTAGG